MQIFFSFYQLKRKQKSNSQVNSKFQSGALIKIVDDNGRYGVADLCPWPELGDLNLEQEIAQQGPLFKRALQLAHKDLQARVTKTRLVSSAPVKNHIIVTDFENFQFPIQPAIFKIKGSKNYRLLAQWLNQNGQQVVSFRLDFNSCLQADEFADFLNLLSEATIKKIEVIEDPFPFNFEKWSHFQNKVNLAIDFEKGSWPNKVEKPVRQEVSDDALYLTSSMDHPVGLAHGMAFAQRFPLKTHGFLTLDVYEKSKYSQSFTQLHDLLTFQSDWSGIGFSMLLEKENWIPEIHWEKTFNTVLLYNPQATAEDIQNLFQIKKQFINRFPSDHILIASSGSTQKPGDLKVFAFHKSALLQSAKRVVDHFKLTEQMNWGCVLPLFHVGGLGILARAFTAGSKVFYSTWSDFSVDWIQQNEIQLLSLVPTQIFDIVNRQIPAPLGLKHVFIGGAALELAVEEAARILGWPLRITYGMTETASMISKKNVDGFFELFEGVELYEIDQNVFVKTNSQAMMQLNFIDGQITQKDLIKSGIELPDRIEQHSNKLFSVLGRNDDQIKINGELVNLVKLKSLLPIELRQRVEIVPVPDERKGFALVLVGEQVSLQDLRQAAVKLNLSVKKFEKIELIDTLNQFPRSALNKIRSSELKNLIESKKNYEKL